MSTTTLLYMIFKSYSVNIEQYPSNNLITYFPRHVTKGFDSKVILSYVKSQPTIKYFDSL